MPEAPKYLPAVVAAPLRERTKRRGRSSWRCGGWRMSRRARSNGRGAWEIQDE
jgi:hypothetical protein